ncbi:MAG: glycoside hydrolase family 13 [Gemmatimonadetes bacterium]|nr:MAG: glycoside hydrolase family 13 [Gemmatimonadota bacterium]
MSGHDFHPLVKQLLDGDITLADLPSELRVEGEAALRLLAAVDRTEISMPAVTWRVMATLERRRRRFLPWLLAPALAIAAALVILLRPTAPAPTAALVTVRFVLVAPDAKQVSLAGTFNQWDAHVTPLVRTGATGVWTATLTLPAGQHQYAFVVDGVRWVPDPGAPAVDDGFGRRNSVLTL